MGTSVGSNLSIGDHYTFALARMEAANTPASDKKVANAERKAAEVALTGFFERVEKEMRNGEPFKMITATPIELDESRKHRKKSFDQV